jgi:hypothetical protein
MVIPRNPNNFNIKYISIVNRRAALFASGVQISVCSVESTKKEPRHFLFKKDDLIKLKYAKKMHF